MLVCPYRADLFWSTVLRSGRAPNVLSFVGTTVRLIRSMLLRWALHPSLSWQKEITFFAFTYKY